MDKDFINYLPEPDEVYPEIFFDNQPVETHIYREAVRGHPTPVDIPLWWLLTGAN
jgi:hypothetical protein